MALSYSGLDMYRECPARWWYKTKALGTGIYQASETTPEMSYGSFWHAMYDVRIKDGNAEEQRKVFYQTLKRNHTDAHNAEGFFTSLSQDLDWYFDQTRDMKANVLHSEEPLVLKVKSPRTGLDHELIAIPDLVAEVAGDWGGGLYIIDHKTHVVLRRDGKIYLKPYEASVSRQKHSRQFPSYMGVWNRLNPDRKINDAILNFVPQNVSEVMRVQAGRRGNQAPPEITREFIFHEEEFIEAQIVRWIAACDEISVKLMEQEPEKQFKEFQAADNGTACYNSYGRACTFLDLCEATSKTRLDLMQFAFERKK